MADLAAQEEYAANQMAWEYADRIQRLEGSLRAVENDMLSRSLRGESIPVSWLHRQDSYNRLIVQAADEFDKYGKIAGSYISQAQKDAVYRAANLAKEQVKAAVPLATGLNSFQKLPAKSLERLVGNLQADSPLAERLADFGDWASGTISEEMKHSLAAGINPRQTMKNVTDKLGYAPTRAATMLRTEQYRAFRQSLLDNYRNNPNLVKAWIWNAHTGDRTCPICWAMHGTEWPLDDVMATHPNCFLPGTIVSADSRIESVYRRVYEGEIITVTTASGDRIEGTPNHPMLTTQGRITLGALNVGDNLICDSRGYGYRYGVNPEIEDKPTAIEQVFETFSQFGVMSRVDGSPIDFHGDGRQGDVDIVRTGRKLGDSGVSSLGKEGEQFDFPLSGPSGHVLPVLCPLDTSFDAVFLAASGVMGGFSQLGTLKRSHAAVPFNHTLGPPPRGNTIFLETEHDTRSVAVEVLSNGFDRFPGFIPLDYFGGGQLVTTRGMDPGFDKDIFDSIEPDPITAAQVLDRLSGNIATDRVVSVERRAYFGHVYNLQTELGYYSVGNNIAHIAWNCRCNMIPKTPSWAELGYADIPETGPDVTPGPELFKQLGEAAQRRILGPRRFDLYKAGKIDLPDMVRNTYTRDWGDGKALFDIPTTLRNAEQRLAAEAQEVAELAAKPKRGRPKGSKNKPKLSSREKELGLNPLPEDAPEWAKKVREMQVSPTLNPSDEETLRAAGSLLREQFEERQARAGLEMAREKVRLKAREKELYSEYQKIDDELYARRAKLTNDMTDPDYLTLPQFYELPENAPLFKRLTEIDAELQETTRKLANFDDEILAAERKARVDILNTVRPMGGKKKLSWYKPGRGRGWREGESYVAENAEYMPRSWWDKAASGRPMRVIEVRRGYYDGNSQSAVTIALSGGDPNHIKSTAIHEIGHWMENNIPGITEAEKAFYERRTLGEALAHMGPGYRENEVTRRDQFINPYMGKDYGGSYYELLTMGVQSTFRHSILDDDILSDKDYADFILGLLALVP